jgi:hypothetical protein
MSRRRSLRHLTAIAAGSGLITLAVAFTGITPVWLAVGPLLLVILDTLAYSPAVHSRAGALAARLPRLSLPLRHMEPDAAFSMDRHSRLKWLLVVLTPVVIGVAVQLLPTYGWLAVVAGLGPLAVLFVARALGHRLAALPAFLTALRGYLADAHVYRDADVRPPFPAPASWLDAELRAASRGLSIVVVSFAGPAPGGRLADVVAALAQSRGTHIHYLSDDEFLLVGEPDAVHAALSKLGQARLAAVQPGAEPPGRRLAIGEALYPRDGERAAELIAKARQTMQPVQ